MEITIDKLIYGGDGLGRMPADADGRSKAVFVPFVLEGERVDVAPTEQKPGFARARLEQILAASPLRTEPRCPYFARCGGCHYQHTGYEEQLRIKAAILRETLSRTAKYDLDVDLRLHASEPWNYRNRTRMKLQSQAFAVGYFRHGSHELLAVRECPISSPLINRALSAIWDLGEQGLIPPDAREVQYFANHDDTALLLEVYVERKIAAERYADFADHFMQRVQETAGVVVFESARGSDDESERGPLVSSRTGDGIAYGDSALMYATAEGSFRVSAGSFFQTNRHLTDELLRVVAGEGQGDHAMDLYAGTGLFSIPLAKRFRSVTAVEPSQYSSADLRHNAPQNVKAIRKSTEDFLRQSAKLQADLVVVDPPRSGLGERTTRALAGLRVPRITYVSCDPSTLSRDLRVLLQSGFRVEQAHLFDLFPQTFHMESVFHLVR